MNGILLNFFKFKIYKNCCSLKVLFKIYGNSFYNKNKNYINYINVCQISNGAEVVCFSILSKIGPFVWEEPEGTMQQRLFSFSKWKLIYEYYVPNARSLSVF